MWRRGAASHQSLLRQEVCDLLHPAERHLGVEGGCRRGCWRHSRLSLPWHPDRPLNAPRGNDSVKKLTPSRPLISGPQCRYFVLSTSDGCVSLRDAGRVPASAPGSGLRLLSMGPEWGCLSPSPDAIPPPGPPRMADPSTGKAGGWAVHPSEQVSVTTEMWQEHRVSIWVPKPPKHFNTEAWMLST